MSIEKSLSKEEKIKDVLNFFGVSIRDKVSVLFKKAGADEYDWEDGEVFGADTDKEELIIKLLSGEIIKLNKSQINDLEKSNAEDEDDEEEEEEIDEEFIKNLPPEKRKYFKKTAARLEEKKPVDAEEIEEELEEEIKPEIKVGSRVVFMFKGNQESGKVISAEENGFVKVIKDSDKKIARVAVNKLNLESVKEEEIEEEELEEVEEEEELEGDKIQERFEKFKNQTEKLINKYNKELVEESDNDKKETIRHKLKNLDIIYTAKNFEEAKDRIDRSISLSKEEKISLFESLGISKENFEKIDNEAVNKLKKKLQEYIEAENKIIKEVEKIPQGKRTADEKKYLHNASTRIITWNYMNKKTDWTVGDYKTAVQQTYENPIKNTNFYVIKEDRFNELMGIIEERDRELNKIILKISTEPEKSEEEIKQEILEFFGVKIGDRVKVRFDEEEAEENGVEEYFGVVAGAGMELSPDYDKGKEPKKEKVIKIKFKNTIGTFSILKDEKNQGYVKKATDEEREKMILSELNEEVQKMFGVLRARRDLNEITWDEYYKKNSALEWIEKTKDIKTAKEMIGMALNKGGINEEEARRLYGILEIPEDEINELVRGGELTPEERENKETERKIMKMRGPVRHKQVALDSLFAKDKDKENEEYQRASGLISKILGSKNIQEAVLNIREAKVMDGISLGEAETFLQQLELSDKEIDKEKLKILLVFTLKRFKIQLISYSSKEIIDFAAKNEEVLNKIVENSEFTKINIMFATQEDEAIKQLAEIIKKELAAKEDEKPTEEEKRIEIKSRKDAEDYLAKREEAILASGNPVLIDNLKKMKEKIEWLKKAGVA